MTSIEKRERSKEHTGEKFLHHLLFILILMLVLRAAGIHQRLQWHRERASEPFKDVISARALPFLSFSHSPYHPLPLARFFLSRSKKIVLRFFSSILDGCIASHNVLPFFLVFFLLFF